MSQLSLFVEPEAPQRDVERKWQLAFSPEVERVILATLAARRGEWLKFRDFRLLIDQFDIGCCFGHTLGAIHRKGLIEERKVYYNQGIGGDTPGSGHYQGYYHEWRSA